MSPAPSRSFRKIGRDDLGHQAPHRGFFRWREVGLLRFGVDREQEQRDALAVVVVDHAYASTFPPSRRTPTDFADTSRIPNHRASGRIAGNVLDELFAFVGRQASFHLRHERASFHDGEIEAFAHFIYW